MKKKFATRLLTSIIALIMLFTGTFVPSTAAPVSAVAEWNGYKEVAVTCATAEEVNLIYALRDGLDYIVTRENEDFSVDVVFHIRTQEEENILKQYSGYHLVEDHTFIDSDTGVTLHTFAEEAGDVPYYFEVNSNGYIVGISNGDNSNSLVNPGESVWVDYIIDYEGFGVTYDPIYGFPNRIGYRTVSEYYSEMLYLAKNYPHLVKLHTMGYSWYGRPMYVMEICNQPGVEDGRPEWLHLAATHAREWPANELALNNAWWFVKEYQKYLDGRTDYEPKIIDIMKTVRTWVTPLHNPDGTHWDQAAGNSQRKNRRPAATPAQFGQKYFGTTSANVAAGSLGAANYIGTDVNRNWKYRFGSSDGSSIWNQTSESTNRGMVPGGEPENIALNEFFKKRMIGSDISGHTYGDLVIYPWANKKGMAEVNGVLDFSILGRELSSYNLYSDYYERVIYSQSGEGQDYMYGGYRSLGFTVEMGQSFKPTYVGTNIGYATTSYQDRNPNVGLRVHPMNYASATRPTAPITAPVVALLPPAIYSGSVMTVPAPTTFVPTYTHSSWRTTDAYLQAELDKDPNFVRGKILLCYTPATTSGTGANSQHSVARLAQTNGAVGIIYCTIPSTIAGDSSHGILAAPGITATGTSAVTIPVAGTGRMNVRELFEFARDGKDTAGNDVVNLLTLEPGNIQWNRFAWTFGRNAYVYITLAEFAKEYSSHIKGSVTDNDGNFVRGANLNLSKEVYNTLLAENSVDVVFWNPATHTAGQEGPASTASTANRKPDWSGVNWAQYAPWGHGVNTNTANLDPALVNHAADIQAWFKANPPKSRYYDDIYSYVNPVTGDTFRTIKELQTGHIDILKKDGSFDWSVVPSQQPETYAYEGRMQPNWTGGNSTNQSRGTAGGFEVTSAADSRIGKYIYQDEGYNIVAKAPGYYDSVAATVFVEGYKVVKDNVNFKLAEAIKPYYNSGRSWFNDIDNTIRFSTFELDETTKKSTKKEIATVYATIGGKPANVVSLGGGDYTLTFKGEDFGLAVGDKAELVIDFTGGAVHTPYTDTLLTGSSVPLFTDANGNSLTSLTSNTLVTTMLYENDSDTSENLMMISAVYSKDGKLVHISTDTKVIGAGDTVTFSTKINMPENLDGIYSDKDYYAIVFLWDSLTFIPVREKYGF